MAMLRQCEAMLKPYVELALAIAILQIYACRFFERKPVEQRCLTPEQLLLSDHANQAPGK